MASDGAGRAADAAELRLRELTDQALVLLDQLAEARDQARHAEAERREWHARCVALEARLADAGARLRRSASVRLAHPGALVEPGACEVVLWLDASVDERARDHWFAALRRWLADRPATLVVGRDQVPPERIFAMLPTLAVLESPGPRPAALWNLALSAARAPLVLLVGPGVVPGPELTAAALARYDDPAIAVVQPLLTVAGRPTMGWAADDGLRLRRRPHPGVAADDLVDLDFAAPDAFAVRRAAFDRIGAFDQDLGGRLALVDFCLRARQFGHRIAGAPRLRATVAATAGDAADRVTRDHLLLLARHRPQHLAGALARTPGLWSLPPDEQRELVVGLLRHLPAGGSDDELIVALLAGIVADTVPWARLESHLRQLGTALQVELLHAGEGGSTPAPAQALDAALERLQALIAARDELEQRLHEVAKENGDLHQRLHLANVALEAERQRAAALAHVEQRLQQVTQERDTLRQHQLVLQDELTAAMRILQELRDLVERGHAKREELSALRDTAERERATRGALAAALGMPPDTGVDRLLAEVARSGRLLGERNAWIRALLREKATRRIKLRPRLLEHEERFLAETEPP